MKQTKVAIRYAKSFLSLSKEKGLIDGTRGDMELVKNTLKSSKDLTMLLQNPIVSTDKKAGIIKEVFKGKISDASQNFLDIIVSKGRESVLSEIADEYIRVCKEDSGIYQGTVISAYPLTSDQRSKVSELAKKMHEGTFELTEEINADLIGGFILKIGDQMIDTSLRKQLRSMRQEFTDNP